MKYACRIKESGVGGALRESDELLERGEEQGRKFFIEFLREEAQVLQIVGEKGLGECLPELDSEQDREGLVLEFVDMLTQEVQLLLQK